ncbi:MAG: discoidin domain-containing protein [Oscillospiraceae bacterium]|nr:discoidin domain-containing protein [Oscillospiraceae bacterium]
MKKVLCLLTALVMVFGCVSINVSAADYGEVLNNNVALMVGNTAAVSANTLQTLSTAPAEVDGVILIPLSAVSVLFNGITGYDAATGYIDIRFGVDKTVVMKLGSKTYTFNGRGYTLDVAPYVEGSDIMIPLRTLTENVIGQVYFYDANTRLIIISSRGVIRNAATDAAVISTIVSALQSRVLPPISVPTRYELDWSIPVEESTIGGPVANDNGPIQSSMSNSPIGTKINLNAGMIKASYEPEANNPAVNAIDGSTSSVWATEGMQEFLIDLGQATSIACVGVRMMNYPDGRSIYYAIDVSADGSTYRAVFDGQSASGGNVDEYHTVGVNARYIKVSPKGNTNENNDWASVAEIEVYSGSVTSAPAASSSAGTAAQVKSSSPSGTKLSGLTATFTAEPESNNPGRNAIDGNSSTYWAVENSNSMTIDLGSAQPVSCVGVQMRNYIGESGDSRTVNYGVEISADGSSYNTLYNGASAAGGGVMEYINAGGASARYVKINLNGSSTNGWASLAEVEVYTGTGAAAGAGSAAPTAPVKTTTPYGTKLSGLNATFTAEPESNNPGRNALDGNSSTYWAVENSNSMTIDLGSSQPIGSVGVQMRNYIGESGDSRTVNYGVEVSEDGSGYTPVYSGASAAGGGVMEYITVGANARYVKINLNGSSTNGWASLAEVEVYAGEVPTAGGATGSSTYPNMSSVSGQFILADPATNNVLTVESDDLTLTVAPYSKAAKQIWTLGYNSFGNTVKSAGTDAVIDVFEQSTAIGGQVGVYEDNDGNNQTWSFELDGDGYYVRNAMSGLYLSVSGGGIAQLDRGAATKWVVADRDAEVSEAEIPVNPNVPTAITRPISGRFKISVYGTGSVLSANGTSVYVGRNDYLPSQTWTMEETENGFVIINEANDYVLEVAGEAVDAGYKVALWENNDGAHQAWVLEKQGNFYYIKNANSGLYICQDATGVRQREFGYATKWAIRNV